MRGIGTEHRIHAIKKLGEARVEQAIPALVDLLGGSHDQVELETAKALVLIDKDMALEVIRKRVKERLVFAEIRMYESTRRKMKRNIVHWYMKAIASIRKAMNRLDNGVLSQWKPKPPNGKGKSFRIQRVGIRG